MTDDRHTCTCMNVCILHTGRSIHTSYTGHAHTAYMYSIQQYSTHRSHCLSLSLNLSLSLSLGLGTQNSESHISQFRTDSEHSSLCSLLRGQLRHCVVVKQVIDDAIVPIPSVLGGRSRCRLRSSSAAPRQRKRTPLPVTSAVVRPCAKPIQGVGR